jgi:hypothetical protein
MDGFLKGTRASPPAVIFGMLFRKLTHCTAKLIGVREIVVHVFQTKFKVPGLCPHFFKGKIT